MIIHSNISLSIPRSGNPMWLPGFTMMLSHCCRGGSRTALVLKCAQPFRFAGNPMWLPGYVPCHFDRTEWVEKSGTRNEVGTRLKKGSLRFYSKQLVIAKEPLQSLPPACAYLLVCRGAIFVFQLKTQHSIYPIGKLKTKKLDSSQAFCYPLPLKAWNTRERKQHDISFTVYESVSRFIQTI